MGMEAAAPAPRSRKRKAPATPATEAPCPEPALPIAAGDGGGAGGDRISDLLDAVSLRPRTMEMETAVAAATAEGHASESTAEDRLSGLPDGVLGDIVSLLPTREGARTQILSSRWRHLWRSAPLNLDHGSLCDHPDDFNSVVSRVLAAHPGPGRRFSAPVYHLWGGRATTADAWLRSPALDNLHELELCSYNYRLLYPPATPQPPPEAAFRFSDTLRVATIGECHLPHSTIQGLRFPKLQKLALERNCSGFRCLRINSITLRGVGVRAYNYHKVLKIGELVIENAPCLENFQHGLRVHSLTKTVCTVKILAIDMSALSLDVVINLMRCFPCLEKLYIESIGSGKTNSWRRKHQTLIRSLDIRLKTFVWEYYEGIKSHVNFATFFIRNAKMRELMTLKVNPQDYNEEFFAQQRKMLQLDNKASGGARLHFTPDRSHRSIKDFGVHDLDLVDPFVRRHPYQFHTLS
ncbi:F-box/FBD/LRR-repeat protein At5g56420-like [Triticum urartu]|uniref:F-box/FBD/LRR-repeat protein At5g56420-like n=1 Tax=Triticum urartu TaxID=4572 RepID=UPI0020437CAC|nr:F-box/FBD/LRR-repeat protein At5g56420-like [Triticum urartu]